MGEIQKSENKAEARWSDRSCLIDKGRPAESGSQRGPCSLLWVTVTAREKPRQTLAERPPASVFYMSSAVGKWKWFSGYLLTADEWFLNFWPHVEIWSNLGDLWWWRGPHIHTFPVVAPLGCGKGKEPEWTWVLRAKTWKGTLRVLLYVVN